jgi:hypothetical protein
MMIEGLASFFSGGTFKKFGKVIGHDCFPVMHVYKSNSFLAEALRRGEAVPAVSSFGNGQ